MGATDLQHALSRAVLQGRIETARRLLTMGAHLDPGIVMGPSETLNGSGLAFLIELGADLADDKGDRLAPIAMMLETYNRNPEGKHRCLEIAAQQGVDFPDTAPVALHRGRIDLLDTHLRRDPTLLTRTFTHEEIFPPELGCHADPALALCGTPLDGATLLHMAVEYDEIEIAPWLIEKGMDVDAQAGVDSEGFGGHTALFACVVSEAYLCGGQRDGALARLLLDHGADPNVRASLWKRLIDAGDDSMREYRNVTPLAWGERFHNHRWVNPIVLSLLRNHRP
ncbi:hypothetical protein BH11ARM2_BH11ARM2_04660 [soil metagenome]